jgi:NAD(P)H-hydrate epimerase
LNLSVHGNIVAMDPAKRGFLMSTSPNVELVLHMPRLAPRPCDAHKGMFGRVLVVAGSRGMSGAAVLSATAALRGGAGLVRVAVPQGIWPVVAMGNPSYMTAPLADDAAGLIAAGAEAELLTHVSASDILAVGPGLGRGEAITRLVFALIGAGKPMVLDADGLNAIVGRVGELKSHSGPLVLTPHPGEFSRLTGMPTSEIAEQRNDAAVNFAAAHKVVLVLKGNESIVTDGKRFYLNTTGNAGMATGGSGDVLTGLIAALMGQRLAAFEAAQLGVWLHGRAGDLACEDIGEVGLIASDLLTYLPKAFRNP